ncbi:MAG: Rieske (2Fe-2S) protein [Deinococcota bacterium]|nr:Rieske (2Fe-2S) protein [Deinococcota bacterium]
MPKTRDKVPVASINDIPPGERKLVEVKGKSIGVFNVNGAFVAMLNYCPHEGAPVCLGRVSGTTLPSPPGEYRWGREGEILTCPWHGWEFDLLTGACLTDKRRLKKYPVSVETYPVTVEEGRVFVTV